MHALMKSERPQIKAAIQRRSLEHSDFHKKKKKEKKKKKRKKTVDQCDHLQMAPFPRE